MMQPNTQWSSAYQSGDIKPVNIASGYNQSHIIQLGILEIYSESY